MRVPTPELHRDQTKAGCQRRRRPEYRGERRAVLVRLPVEVAAELKAAAGSRGSSVSDTAAALIASGLTQRVSA